MKVPSWRPRRSPHRSRHDGRQGGRGDDAAADGVLEVVADVGDPVGPADHLALGGGGCRPGPGVVADAVERLLAQVERGQRHVGPPWGVVEAAVDVGGERVLAGMAARAVAAVVPEGDGLGQGHVQPAGPGDPGGHLGDLECVGQPGPLVVVGEDEDLGLAGQAPERAARAGSGPGRARSTSATGPAPRPGPGSRPWARVAPGAELHSLELLAGGPVEARDGRAGARSWRGCPDGRR